MQAYVNITDLLLVTDNSENCIEKKRKEIQAHIHYPETLVGNKNCFIREPFLIKHHHINKQTWGN